MEHVALGSVKGIDVAAPYARRIQVLFAPDVRRVDELTFSLVQIQPGGGLPTITYTIDLNSFT